MPGTTSNGIPASARASASSPPRPNTNGSPPLSRTTHLALPARGRSAARRSAPGARSRRRAPCRRRSARRPARAGSRASAGISRSWTITSAADEQLQRAHGHQARDRRARLRRGRRCPERRSCAGLLTRPPPPARPDPADPGRRRRSCARPARGPGPRGRLASPPSWSRIHSLPSGSPQKPRDQHPPARGQLGVDADRRVAARLQRRDGRPLAADRGQRLAVGDRLGARPRPGRPAGTPGPARPGPGPGSAARARTRRRSRSARPSRRRPAAASTSPSKSPDASRSQPGVDVAAQRPSAPGRAAGPAAGRGGAGWRSRSARPRAPRPGEPAGPTKASRASSRAGTPGDLQPLG